jgi:hypothetical protein
VEIRIVINAQIEIRNLGQHSEIPLVIRVVELEIAMKNLPFHPKLPEFAESEQAPLARSLLQIIASSNERIQRLEETTFGTKSISNRVNKQ